MTTKRNGVWPLPGGVESYFETLLALLEFCHERSPTKIQLEAELRNEYAVSGDTAIRGYVRMLMITDLFEEHDRVLVPSASGRALLASREPAEVYSLLVERFLGIDVTLALLAAQPGTISQLHARLTAQLGVSWTSTNQTMFRVCWLRSLALAQKRDDGGFEITPKGRALVHDVPEPVPGPTPLPTKQALPGSIDALCAELVQTATDGGDGQAFERCLERAFAQLGLESRRLGGSGEPDVIVDMRRGPDPVRVIVEAKSTTRGVIPDSQIDWDSILDHKYKHDANLAMIVGVAFAGGNLELRAVKKAVRLLSTEQLILILRSHDQTPLGVDDLLPIFQGAGSLSDEDMAVFLQRVADIEPWADRVSQVFDVIWSRQGEQRARLDTNALFFVLGEDHDAADLEQVVAFLASPLLRAVATQPDGRLYTLCSPAVLAARLKRLRSALSTQS